MRSKPFGNAIADIDLTSTFSLHPLRKVGVTRLRCPRMGSGEIDLVSAIDVADGCVRVTVDAALREDFLREDFFACYELDGSPAQIVDGLALVPFLANIAPLVWLAGLDVRVPALDSTFVTALNDVREVLARMYPSVQWEGSIRADEPLGPSSDAAWNDDVSMLFSGGVDSTYSALSLGSSEALLITVWGADIPLDNPDSWTAHKDKVRAFALARGHRNGFVRSNFRQFLDVAAIERRWPQIGGWWAGVQHGMGLLGLAAPLVTSGQMLIAATHTDAFTQAWASNPALDNAMKWADVRVEHHGHDVSRQGKIEAIAGDPQPVTLRVCHSEPYGGGGNCGRCEKCMRTFAGLLAAGIDPAAFGVDIPAGARLIRRRFKTYRMPLSANEAFMWSDIQHAARRQASAGDAGEFLRWLAGFDVARYERVSGHVVKARKRIMRFVRRFPAIERTLHRAIAAWHRLRR